MKIKKALENRVRGWLPKEPDFSVHQRTTNDRVFRTTKAKIALVTIWSSTYALGVLLLVVGLSGPGIVILGLLTGIVVSDVLAIMYYRMGRKEKTGSCSVENMNAKRSLENRIRGWLPRETNFPVFQSTDRHRLFTKTRLLWLCAGIIAAVVVSGVIFVAFFVVQNVWQKVDTSVAESENTVNSFIAALNSYDANTAWNLMSPSLQTSYGTMQNFNDTVISALQESGWHAQLLSMVSIDGNFTLPGSLVHSSAQIKTELKVTHKGVPTNVTYVFELVKPSEWRINNKLTIT